MLPPRCDQNPLISHDVAVETLRHIGVDAETISEALRDFAFPAPLSKVLQHLAHHGMARQSLIEMILRWCSTVRSDSSGSDPSHRIVKPGTSTRTPGRSRSRP